MHTDFEPFLAAVRARLEAGRQTFGDRSLERPAPELIAEVQEELADVCGWAALLWVRLERLRTTAERLERPRVLQPYTPGEEVV